MNDNTFINNALAHLTKNAAPKVVSAIRDASTRTGVDFSYLMEQAAAESSFNADAKATTSSARGLYQFIESTWMRMVKNYGAKHGLEKFAAQIDDHGKVSDEAVKKQILDLRFDPQAASNMAAEFAAENKDFLQKHLGKDFEIGATDLYLAHFLGASGATGFLQAMATNPLQTAAHVMPKAAKANHNVFFDKDTGEARSLAGVYEFFEKKFAHSEAADTALTDGGLNVQDENAEAAVFSPLIANQQAQAIQQIIAQRQSSLMGLFENTLSMHGSSSSDHAARNFGGGSDVLSRLAGISQNTLVQSPVELMMLAQLNPLSEDNKETPQR